MPHKARAGDIRRVSRSNSGRGPVRTRFGQRFVLTAAIAILFLSTAARADEFYNPKDTFGEVGILDMPSSRMAPDGEVSITAGILGEAQRFNFGFQILPWLSGSFRYSSVHNIRSTPILFDRSFGMKMRLFQETPYFPEISLGIRDILGTGVYSSEYFVASKQWGDVDLTAGLGWGRLAGNGTFPNPFGLLIPSFKVRKNDFASTTGGIVNFAQFFHGPKMGLFGGLVWHTPVDKLNLLLEYSSDRYTEEAAGGFKVRIPVNVGLSYRLYDVITASAGWYYGTTYGVTFSVSADPTVYVTPHRIGPDVPRPAIRTDPQQVQALHTLFARNSPTADRPDGPWVSIPGDKSGEDLALQAALVSEGAGVRDVEIFGHTLLIEAGAGTHDACGRYAQIASAVTARIDTVAVSDASDSGGKVAICPTLHFASLSGHATPAASAAADAAADTAPENEVDVHAVEEKITADIAGQALRVEAVSVESTSAWLYYSNARYANEAEAVGRIARVLMADCPPGVEIFHVTSVKRGQALREVQITRSALERAVESYGSPFEQGQAIALQLPPLDNPILDKAQDASYPRYHWSIGPGFRQGFFNPKTPVELQVFASLDVSLDVTPNFTLEGRYEANIFNNYDVTQDSDSLLPHVRSDVNQYFQHGANGIDQLDAVYRSRITRDVFAEFKAGYVESMFAGAGGQVLWRPEQSRFAVSAALYQVWQRDFDKLFGLQKYHVLTGHVAVYYESPWYGLNFRVKAGRYLAGDYGATFQVTRRFSTGVEIGAYATFTNVPFKTFGEGSFDKGIFIHIPFEWAFPFYTQSSYDLNLRSLIRDGGQALLREDSLYDETRDTSYDELSSHFDDVILP